ncbi:class I SAM-dependent methyltransferase [Pseudonocardia sp. CA-107938]|uniref:class I SAM-dependent methyltransferase n=1 Tax=Pseudonocardia sp. CA-107938 TaxID=3240021 RepID=UPI003D93952F
MEDTTAYEALPESPDAVAASTAEVRAAHDVLAELYAERLADALDRMPVDRAVLGLFCELTRSAGVGDEVGDIGCGTGRLTPFLAAHGLAPRGVDLSPGMIDVARREHPGVPFEVADVRALPFPDASLAGVVCWYSLMYLPPAQRPLAFAELARVVRPGGYLTAGFKAGDDQRRRGGRSAGLGVVFDVWWHSPEEVQQRLTDAEFEVVFRGWRPPQEEYEASEQGFVVARRVGGGAGRAVA